MADRLPLIGQGAYCWRAGCCDDSRLARGGRLRAEVDEARTVGRALLRRTTQRSGNHCVTVLLQLK